jgi:oxaloacetate decarboxylase alpha subunit
LSPIRLVDVSLRDGNQSLWGATGLNTRQILAAAPLLDRVGFQAFDFTSSTHMAVAVRYCREDPWQRIRLMRRAAPQTPLQFITTGLRFISWEIADLEFMRLVYRRLVANGMSRFIILDPMHDMDALCAAARLMREEGAADIMGALTFTVSDVHDDAFYAGIARQMAACADIDRVYLKDPSGLLTPERTRTLLPTLVASLAGKPLELHSHCTIGLGQLNYLAAAELGIDILHTGLGPLGNGSSLPEAVRLVDNLRAHGHEVAIDDDALRRAAGWLTQLAAAEGLPAGTPQDYDAAFFRHQIAGGVLTTLRRQLTELGLEDKLPAVIDEVERVRAELGHPIMVTPFPQIVCTQALLNITGRERYGSVPDQVIRYVIERFGRPTRPVAPWLRERILGLPRTRELLAEPPAPTLAELRTRIGRHLPDDEFLLRAVMPAEQVDAMIATPTDTRPYTPELQPLLKLLSGIVQRTDLRQLALSKPGFRLDLRRRSNVETS